MTKLGTFLKETRKKNKFSVSRVANKLGVNEDYIFYVEENQIAQFSEKRLKDIIVAYDLNKEEKEEFYKLMLSKK